MNTFFRGLMLFVAVVTTAAVVAPAEAEARPHLLRRWNSNRPHRLRQWWQNRHHRGWDAGSGCTCPMACPCRQCPSEGDEDCPDCPREKRRFEQAPAYAGETPKSNGLIRQHIKPSGERYQLGSKEVTADDAKRALIGATAIPDDSTAPSLTIIGAPDERALVLADLARPGPLHDAASTWLLQDYEPTNPLLKKRGFKTDGHPTIYGEKPDGTVYFCLGTYPGAEQLAAQLLFAQQPPAPAPAPVPLPQPAPPAVQPMPQSPPIGQGGLLLLATHFLALVLGAGTALGGQWAIYATLLAPIANAVEQRLQQRFAPKPPPA